MGFGKSMCYEVLPFVFDVKLGRGNNSSHSAVIIVSPLVSLTSASIRSKYYTTWISSLHAATTFNVVIRCTPPENHVDLFTNYAHAQTVDTRPLFSVGVA